MTVLGEFKMPKCKQNSYLFSLFIALFFYSHTAQAIPKDKKGSEFGSCLFEHNGSHYAAEWQIDHGPNGNSNTEFNVDFYQVCGCKNRILLTSRTAPPDANTVADKLYLPYRNSEFFSYHTSHYLPLPNNELYSHGFNASFNPVNVQYKTKYTVPDQSGNNVTLEGLSYAESKNPPETKNKVWWRISSNDNNNSFWTIEFNYNIGTAHTLINAKEAICQVRYSPNTERIRDNSAVYVPLPNSNYFNAFEEAYPVQSTCALTCNLL